ncbi:rRNA-processing protein EBP2 [Hypoxylon texense]
MALLPQVQASAKSPFGRPPKDPNGPVFPCAKCPYVGYKKAAYLKNHIKRNHIGTRCAWPGCNAQTNSEWELKAHIRETHMRQVKTFRVARRRVFRCPWPPGCGKSYQGIQPIYNCVYTHTYDINKKRERDPPQEQTASQDDESDHQMLDHSNPVHESGDGNSEHNGSGSDHTSNDSDSDNSDKLDKTMPTNAKSRGGLVILIRSMNDLTKSIRTLNVEVKETLGSIVHEISETKKLIRDSEKGLDARWLDNSQSADVAPTDED